MQNQTQIWIKDFPPFGSAIIEMQYKSDTGGSYRYGFNGEELMNELSGDGMAYDLGERFYDGRLGKMFSLDPLSAQYPWQSPYAYCYNNPIWIIDVKGMGGGTEGEPATHKIAKNEKLWKWGVAKMYYKQYGEGLTFEQYWTKFKEWNKNVDYKEGAVLCLQDPSIRPTVLQSARIADNVYTAKKGDFCEGWKVIDVDAPKEDGFKCVIYEKECFGVKSYVLAYAGTNDLQDAQDDIKQALGKTEKQYPKAKNKAIEFNDGYVGLKTLVGHSLGGGLAAAGARSTGLEAITFNAAALSDGTINRLVLNKICIINNYFIENEAVTYYQLTFLKLRPSGNQHELSPMIPYKTYKEYRNEILSMNSMAKYTMNIYHGWTITTTKQRVNNHLMGTVISTLIKAGHTK